MTPLESYVGQTLDGKYHLERLLGQGGMGAVYLATHLGTERYVALKLIAPQFMRNEEFVERFKREARAAGRMQHPNAVTVTDFGATDDGYLYIVMELLEGRTLRDLVAHDAPLDPARAVSLMLQACAAVGAAHEAGLIHRDLKPANIFIEQRPNFPAVVKVLDFGVAKFAVEEHEDDYDTLTQVGAIIGTPRYMSPEQCSGAAQLTPAADVYSLGIILYEMLTGVAPFNAETPLAIALKQVSEAPVPPGEVVASVPAELEQVVLHALAKNPSDRPADANELRTELHALADDLGFEHSDSAHATTLEDLRNAGTESPSGRLVIDLATLRQVQAAAGVVSADAHNLPTNVTQPLSSGERRRREFNRVNVPLEKPRSNRSQWLVAAIVLLIVVVGSAVLAARWWRGHETGPPGVANANAQPKGSVTPSPASAASPSPSASPSAKPAKSPDRSKPKEPTVVRRVWSKLKRIFK